MTKTRYEKFVEVADLGSKWMVPVAIFAATAWLSHAAGERQSADTRLQACIDKQFKLSEIACRNGTCRATTEDEARHLTGLTKAVRSLCDDADFAITDGVADNIRTAVAASNSVEASAEVERSLGNMSSSPGPPAPAQTPASSRASANVPPRLYVHISDEGQRRPAGLLIDRLEGADFAGRKLRALGPELRPVGKTQLRCITKADCAQAVGLAAYVGSVMGNAVPVVDLSARFEGRTAARPLHYELWIAPGPIRVAGSPVADAAAAPAAQRLVEGLRARQGN